MRKGGGGWRGGCSTTQGAPTCRQRQNKGSDCQTQQPVKKGKRRGDTLACVSCKSMAQLFMAKMASGSAPPLCGNIDRWRFVFVCPFAPLVCLCRWVGGARKKKKNAKEKQEQQGFLEQEEEEEEEGETTRRRKRRGGSSVEGSSRALLFPLKRIFHTYAHPNHSFFLLFFLLSLTHFLSSLSLSLSLSNLQNSPNHACSHSLIRRLPFWHGPGGNRSWNVHHRV